MALPGLFGSNVSDGGGFGPGPNVTIINATMAATDDELMLKLADYWAWANTEPRMIPWHWGNLPIGYPVPTMRWGGEVYPKTMAWIKAKVAQLPPSAPIKSDDQSHGHSRTGTARRRTSASCFAIAARGRP